jgi:hypothetical protein
MLYWIWDWKSLTVVSSGDETDRCLRALHQQLQTAAARSAANPRGSPKGRERETGGVALGAKAKGRPPCL